MPELVRVDVRQAVGGSAFPGPDGYTLAARVASIEILPFELI